MDEVESFEVEGVRIEFFKPRGHYKIVDSSRPYPLILKLTFGRINFMFGESLADFSVQRELIDIYHKRIQSNVLYLPQLKGNLRLFNDFLNIVSPEILVVNRAKDCFGNYFDKGVSYFDIHRKSKFVETTRDGMVAISTDGMEIKTRTFNNGESW
ncbi:MAG: hypothetical protein HY693_00915 [Deltaproteobacteria bacterium]|nr:hypothetical protein [Deltaproteobacteria bacterium]